MCILSLQSLFIKNNFLVEIEDSFNILKQQRLRSHGELLFRLIKKLVETLKLKRLLKHSNKIVFYYVSEAEFNIKKKKKIQHWVSWFVPSKGFAFPLSPLKI